MVRVDTTAGRARAGGALAAGLLSLLYLSVPFDIMSTSPMWRLLGSADGRSIAKILAGGLAIAYLVAGLTAVKRCPRSNVPFIALSICAIALAAGVWLCSWSAQGTRDVVATLAALASGGITVCLAGEMALPTVLASVFVVCFYTVAAYGMGQCIVSGSAARALGPHGVTVTSCLIAESAPLCAFLWLGLRGRVPAHLSALAGMAGVTAIPAMLALKSIAGVGVAAAAWLVVVLPSVRSSRATAATACVAGIALVAVVGSRVAETQSRRSTEASIVGRMALLQTGWSRVRTSWPLGEGPGSPSLSVRNPVSEKRSESYGTHNQPLDVAMRYGAPGVVLSLVVAFAISTLIGNAAGDRRRILAVMWVPIGLISMVETTTLTVATYPLTYMLGVVIALGLDPSRLPPCRSADELERQV